MKSCKAYISGNGYGFGNIGDDAALQAIINILKSAIPNILITVGTKHGKRLDCLPSDITYIRSHSLIQEFKAIRECDWFISGGGTMIGDELRLSFPLGYNLKLISIAKFYGRKVSMLGIGANRLLHDRGVKKARMIVELSDLITLRDEESRDVCLTLGANPQQALTTADPAFLLNAKETPRTKKLKDYLHTKGKVFGINVVNEAWAHLDSYKASLAEVCEHFSAKYGYTPVFFCNEIRPGKFYDFDANRQVSAFLKCEHELLEPVYYSPEEMIDILCVFDFVISLRMHSLIFAAIANIPFVTVSRVDKVDNFMKLFDLKASGSIKHCNSRQLIGDIERLLEGRKDFESNINRRVATLRQDCLKNIEFIHYLHNGLKACRHYKGNIFLLRYILLENKFFQKLRSLLCSEITFAQIVRKLFDVFRVKLRD